MNLKLLRLMALPLYLLLLLTTTTVDAACPADDPCATGSFYRIQSWPVPLQDVNGNSMLSLEEANATSLEAFREIITSMAGNTALAIRFNVTRMTIAPQNYCECNFELAGKGCHGGMPAATLLQCARNCRRGDAACTGSGNIVKQTGGHWYSFPVSTEMGPGGVWKKNAFQVKPANRDWLQNTSIIKRASCFADALEVNPELSIDHLFANAEPCPAVTPAQLAEEAIPRD